MARTLPSLLSARLRALLFALLLAMPLGGCGGGSARSVPPVAGILDGAYWTVGYQVSLGTTQEVETFFATMTFDPSGSFTVSGEKNAGGEAGVLTNSPGLTYNLGGDNSLSFYSGAVPIALGRRSTTHDVIGMTMLEATEGPGTLLQLKKGTGHTALSVDGMWHIAGLRSFVSDLSSCTSSRGFLLLESGSSEATLELWSKTDTQSGLPSFSSLTFTYTVTDDGLLELQIDLGGGTIERYRGAVSASGQVAALMREGGTATELNAPEVLYATRGGQTPAVTTIPYTLAFMNYRGNTQGYESLHATLTAGALSATIKNDMGVIAQEPASDPMVVLMPSGNGGLDIRVPDTPTDLLLTGGLTADRSVGVVSCADGGLGGLMILIGH